MAFEDDSLQFYKIEETERIIPDPEQPKPESEKPGFNFGDNVLPILAPVVIVSIIVFAVYHYRKRASE